VFVLGRLGRYLAHSFSASSCLLLPLARSGLLPTLIAMEVTLYSPPLASLAGGRWEGDIKYLCTPLSLATAHLSGLPAALSPHLSGPLAITHDLITLATSAALACLIFSFCTLSSPHLLSLSCLSLISPLAHVTLLISGREGHALIAGACTIMAMGCLLFTSSPLTWEKWNM